MKKIISINILSIFIFFSIYANTFSNNNSTFPNSNSSPIVTQIPFNSPNIRSWVISSGIFNQDLRTSNTPGFEWPAMSGKFAFFTAGLTIGALVNSQMRMSSASYKGEYVPGYVTDSAGISVAKTDSRFHIYRIKAGDNNNNSVDWQTWGNMVPFGAPFVDANNNGTYEPALDTPGVRGAFETVFLCMTDGFPESHTIGEGFGGGTLPLYNEIHMLGWSFNSPGLEEVQFLKWKVINKSHSTWNSAYYGIVADPDLGFADDDYIGCDTLLQLGYCYNADNDDAGNSYSYGVNPPAVGITLLEGAVNKTAVPPEKIHMSSFTYFTNTSSPGPACEQDPNGEQMPAYYMLKGLKKDETPWVIPPGGAANFVTKFCYSGDPCTGTGWNEGVPGTITGSIWNCGGPTSYSGQYVSNNQSGDRRFIISSGKSSLNISPGDTQTIAIAQLIARGSSNLNSVCLLKTKCATIRNIYLISVKPISTEIPKGYYLHQNYPNPFNPSTKIHFEIPLSREVSEGRGVSIKLIIYDALGREIAVLVNEQLKPGTYEVEWNAADYPSGVYFYKLVSGKFTQTNKMVLIK
jgi:hypothetical protein